MPPTNVPRRRLVPETPPTVPNGEITIWQIEALVAVHESGVSGAFQATGMTIAGIGKALLALEGHFGRKLTRSPPDDRRRTVLNEDGKLLATWAGGWLDDLAKVRELFRSELDVSSPNVSEAKLLGETLSKRGSTS